MGEYKVGEVLLYGERGAMLNGVRIPYRTAVVLSAQSGRSGLSEFPELLLLETGERVFLFRPYDIKHIDQDGEEAAQARQAYALWRLANG